MAKCPKSCEAACLTLQNDDPVNCVPACVAVCAQVIYIGQRKTSILVTNHIPAVMFPRTTVGQFASTADTNALPATIPAATGPTAIPKR
jgi:hypothetical protein